MAGGYNNLGLVGVGDQVHGSAHTLEYLAGDHVICQVAVSAHLESLLDQLAKIPFLYMRARTPRIETST